MESKRKNCLWKLLNNESKKKENSFSEYGNITSKYQKMKKGNI